MRQPQNATTEDHIQREMQEKKKKTTKKNREGMHYNIKKLCKTKQPAVSYPTKLSPS